MQDGTGPLSEHDPNAPPAVRRWSRGGKASRAKRLEKYNESKSLSATTAPATATWARLTEGLLRQHRAKLRYNVAASRTRLRRLRTKIRAAVWSAWTERVYDPFEPEDTEVFFQVWGRPIVTGTDLAGLLSPRDSYIMGYVQGLMVLAGLNSEEEGDRDYRHVLDWLRVETEDGFPHWVHTHRAEDAEMEESCSDSSSADLSDEDVEIYCSEHSSDEDDPPLATVMRTLAL